MQAVVIAFIGIAQGIKMRMDGCFALGDFGVMLLSALLISTLSSSIPMPFVFKHGVEKGRIAYYVMIGFVCAARVFLADLFKGGMPGELSSGLLFAAISAAAVIVYILSWYFSICYYKKRELQQRKLPSDYIEYFTIKRICVNI